MITKLLKRLYAVPRTMWKDNAWRLLGFNPGSTVFDSVLPDRNELLTKTIVDLGCGTAKASLRIPCKKLIAVDVFEPYLEIIRKKGRKNVETRRMNILEFAKNMKLNKEIVDIVLLGDVIEHLEKEQGVTLLKDLKEITERIIVFTPVGPVELDKDPWGFENDEFHTHRSAWYPEELVELGFRVNVLKNYHSKKTNKLLKVEAADAMLAEFVQVNK